MHTTQTIGDTRKKHRTDGYAQTKCKQFGGKKQEIEFPRGRLAVFSVQWG
jgi:hypothetical protein